MRKSYLIIFFLFLIVACKKNSSSPSTNYFQLKMNNIDYFFDSTYSEIDTTTPGFQQIYIYAGNTKTQSYARIGLESRSKKVEGVYSHINFQSTGLYISYYTTALASGQVFNFYGDQGAPFLFTIGKASNNSLQGTFSGTLTNLYGPLSASPTLDGQLSNGEFNITFHYR